ncbi:hypothetical protein VTN00DRAFT_8939 [Thermoascus crustaceus]|uniref:uncharacterized protein n=1 Tax=Thermoascus crustaceus TaxID=5088 RepID=UPI0037439310
MKYLATILIFTELVTSQTTAPPPTLSPIIQPITVFPAAAQNLTSHVRFESDPFLLPLPIGPSSGLDGPKIDLVNNSVFDWWYFDAVDCNNSNTSLTVTLFAASSHAFPYLERSDSVLTAYLWASFPNGTVWTKYMNAELATVVAVGDGSKGDWHPTGFSWEGAGDMSRYEVTVKSSEMDVWGKMELVSVAPAHYPCSPASAGSGKHTFQVAPHIGWSNAVPDATATVNLTIQGEPLTFRGVGYHDKNWSDQPFLNSVGSWYWGHSRLGPYSLVWFHFLPPNTNNTTTYTSSYVAKDGKILVSSCSPTLLSVRPTGPRARYPPRVGEMSEGFHIDFDLGEGDNGGVLSINVTATAEIATDRKSYTRWAGTVSGGLVGGEVYEGAAIFEQFEVDT